VPPTSSLRVLRDIIKRLVLKAVIILPKGVERVPPRCAAAATAVIAVVVVVVVVVVSPLCHQPWCASGAVVRRRLVRQAPMCGVAALLARLDRPPDEHAKRDRAKGNAHGNNSVPAPVVDRGAGRIVRRVLRAIMWVHRCSDRVRLDAQRSQLLGDSVSGGIEDRTRCRVIALQHLIS